MTRGLNILISAGPTHEAIDPVRFIGNRSSGKMGLALAKAFADLGHQVQFITGPLTIPIESHPNIHRTKVESAQDMYNAIVPFQKNYDIGIMTAAVADFTPVNVSDQKIKKTANQSEMSIQLKKTIDILAYLGQHKNNNQTLVGFCLETENESENARRKLTAKKCDLIVLNSLRDENAGFGFDSNKVTVFDVNGVEFDLPTMSKTELGRILCERVLQRHLGNQ